MSYFLDLSTCAWQTSLKFLLTDPTITLRKKTTLLNLFSELTNAGFRHAFFKFFLNIVIRAFADGVAGSGN